MKLFILTCLVAVALARSKLPLRHPELSKNELDNSNEVLKERQFFRKELSEDHVIPDAEKEVSSGSSSVEVAPNNTEKRILQEELYKLNLQILRLINLRRLISIPVLLGIILSKSCHSWLFPMHEISKPIAFEDIENTDNMLPDW
ncbi:alpha-S1-casein-like [Choloepus didactylus]|uniref:alpha-S1-casein-like n=1 Tax=Choloepus didactylus TaxID=27675 RepID=UPI00189CF64E|nr:alpha-S1-casein-like [Choloepus didactylus]